MPEGSLAPPHAPLSDPSSVGVDPRALSRAVSRLRAQQRAGAFPGGQIVVRRHGRVIVDESMGLADGARPGPAAAPRFVRSDTPFAVFSAGKPLVALCIALLDERGHLDVNAPIAEVIPEFGVRGKERLTTLDVLTHTAGIPMADFSRRARDWADWNLVVDAMCAVRPSLPRGTLAYHPLEYGWILAEIVRRVSGRALPDFLDEELLGPAGLGGLRFVVGREEQDRVARPYWLGGRSARIGPLDLAPLLADAERDPAAFLGAFVPGAGLVTDAAHLAALYDLLAAGAVTSGGKRLLAFSTLRRYTARHVFGICRANRYPLAVSRGFLVGTLGPGLYGWWDSRGCFGHAGAFCTVAFADAQTDLAVAVVTNGNRGPRDVVARFPSLLQELRGSVRQPPKKVYA